MLYVLMRFAVMMMVLSLYHKFYVYLFESQEME